MDEVNTQQAEGATQQAEGATQQAEGATQQAEGATQQAEGATQQAEGATPQDEDPVGAPESYEEFTMPEGITLDSAAVEAFTPIAKELNLTQDQAQKLVDTYAGMVQRRAEADEAGFETQVEDWARQAREDEEIGGAAFEANVKLAQKGLAAVGSDELKTLLNTTGLGNNPEMIRLFVRIGKSVGEDGMTTAAAAGGSQRSIADRMYPGMRTQT